MEVLELNRILLAVDGSAFSTRSIAVTIDLATAMHADVLVFHQRGREVEARMDAEMESADRAEDLVGWTVRSLEHAGVASVESRVDVGILGQEAPAILDVAEDFGADLIVMGSRGLTDLSGLLLGSVAHKVIHLASCPVLVVR